MRRESLRGVASRVGVGVLLGPEGADVVGFGAVVLQSSSVVETGDGGKRGGLAHPGDELGVLGLGRHLEHVLHALGQVELAGAVEVGAVLLALSVPVSL